MEIITTKEIVTILKEHNLMTKAYAVDNFIKQIYEESTAKEFLPEFKNGFISFTKDNIKNNDCSTRKEKVKKIKEIINVNYPHTQKGRKES